MSGNSVESGRGRSRSAEANKRRDARGERSDLTTIRVGRQRPGERGGRSSTHVLASPGTEVCEAEGGAPRPQWRETPAQPHETLSHAHQVERKVLARAIPLNYQVRHKLLFSFFVPHFLGPPKSERLLLPRRAAALWEGTQCCKGGTAKAEAAKGAFYTPHTRLPDAGISPKL